MNTILKDKIQEIEHAIDLNWKNNSYVSLLTGIGGIPIFYYVLYQIEGEEVYLKKMRGVVENLYEKLDTEEYGLTYSSGLSGVAYMLNYLNERKVIDDIGDELEFIDESITSFTEKNMKSIDDLDFLHGALGATNYLVERMKKNEKIIASTTDLVIRLCNIINKDIRNAETVRELLEYDDDTHRTNCGLAHGRVSEIIILSKFLEQFPDNMVVRETIRDCVNCLLSFQSEDENTTCAYPSIAVNQKTANYNIHLGWCYGDQVVSLGLYKASKVLNDQEIFSKAKALAYRTLKRNTVKKALLSNFHDSAFCHGASSLAYCNKKWYQITKDSQFKENYEKFIGNIIENGKNDIGLAGYRKYLGNNKFENAIGMLDGVAGIGIVLADYFLEENQVDWDSFFLLN